MGAKRTYTILIALLTLACVPVWAQPGPPMRRPKPQDEIALERLPGAVKLMWRSFGQLTYRGQRTVEFSLNGERHRNVEMIVVQNQRARYEFDKGSSWEGHIIVEDGRSRVHFDPAKNEIERGPRHRDEVIARLRGMLSNPRTRVTQTAGGTVAGRETQLVQATDGQGNVLTKLWIDSATGLLLKRELFDRVGTRTAFFEFTRINFRPTIDPSEFEIRRAGAKVVSPVDRLKKVAQKEGVPAYHLPPTRGAELINIRPIKHRVPAIAQMYQFKGKRLSLFVLKGQVNEQRIGGLAGRDANVHRWTIGGVTLLLMGDPSPKELETLSSQVRLAR